MRKFGFLMVGGAALLMSVAFVEGQQGKGKGGGMQFGGMLPGFGRQDPVSLLNRTDVKKELEVTDDQIEKLPAEVMLAISKVLNEKQFTRFKQLELQKRGNEAFKDEAVLKSLKVTDEQKKNLISIVDDSAKEVRELFKAGGGGFGKGGGNPEKMATITKETKEKIYGVLTKDQRKAWREMVGEEFKFETPTFGNFGKKKDAE